MSGIYIHIPFCKTRCSYCDFYTEVAPTLIPDVINAMVDEIFIRKDYLQDKNIDTIYFGGGTPSVLKPDYFDIIFNAIYSTYHVNSNAEITFEANPDDLTVNFFSEISQFPFNRISIGIQSFRDEQLVRINRRHSAQQAIQAVENAHKAGFKNISIDLIYGLPQQTLGDWEQELKKAFSLGIQHISAYGLTFEEGTAIWKQREIGQIKQVDEEIMNQMYFKLLDLAALHHFNAYEISNFAIDGFRSRHNSSYWKQIPYIGIGPSAHSFNIDSRQWNAASIREYTQHIATGSCFYEKEILTNNEKFNDFVMVALRTSEGVNLIELKHAVGEELASHFIKNINPFIKNGKVEIKDGIFCLTREGILLSNQILTELMKV
jgi:oxygen-independent coproporphyrinogen-3 oxidase